MIEESEKLKSSLEGKAEHLADRLVPYTLGGTALTYLLTRNTTKALSVLMVDFSCALKLAMPISVLSAIREASLYHMTVKGGKYLEAVAEVGDNEIFIRTALSKYTYRICQVGDECWCEYVGAYRGLLEQKLLPMITPKENLLECEVLESSLLGGKPKTLREYAEDNLKLKKFREQNFGTNGFSKADHPRRVYDEFIKEDFIPEDK